MKRRFTRWLMAGVALTLLAAACTFGAEDTGGGGATAAPDEPVTLKVWSLQSPSYKRAFKDLEAGFEEANPNVDVKVEFFDYDTYIQTLQTSLPSGSGADVVQLFGTWVCSYADTLTPVPTDLMSLEDARAAFYEAPIDGFTCDEALYGFPQEFNIEYGATLVNTEIAAAAGVDPTAGWATWDEFRADAKAMTETKDGTITRAGYHFTAGDGLPFTFYSLILQAGGQFLADDGQSFTIDTPEAREAIALMQSIVDDGITDPTLFNDTENWVGDCYFEELCAMGLVGPWVITDYETDFPEVAAATEYVPLPTLADTPDFVADSGWGLTVSADSQATNVAWDFVEYATLDPEIAAQWNIATGTLPGLRANGEGAAQQELIDAFPHFAPWFELLPYGHFLGNIPDRDLLWYEITGPHLLKVLQGSESVDDALAAMESEANGMFR
ncbi:MAG: extracellular solute-binding protein [Actinomycetota bacterium]